MYPVSMTLTKGMNFVCIKDSNNQNKNQCTQTTNTGKYTHKQTNTQTDCATAQCITTMFEISYQVGN